MAICDVLFLVILLAGCGNGTDSEVRKILGKAVKQSEAVDTLRMEGTIEADVGDLYARRTFTGAGKRNDEGKMESEVVITGKTLLGKDETDTIYYDGEFEYVNNGGGWWKEKSRRPSSVLTGLMPYTESAGIVAESADSYRIKCELSKQYLRGIIGIGPAEDPVITEKQRTEVIENSEATAYLVVRKSDFQLTDFDLEISIASLTGPETRVMVTSLQKSHYYDFDLPVELNIPEEALSSKAGQTQSPLPQIYGYFTK